MFNINITIVNYKALFVADLCRYLICLGYFVDLAFLWWLELGDRWLSSDNYGVGKAIMAEREHESGR